MNKQTTLAATCLALMLSGCAAPPPTQQTWVEPVATQQRMPSFTQRSQLGYALRDFENHAAQTFTVQLLPRFGGEALRIGDLFDIDLYSSADAYLHLYLFQNSGTVVALTENLHIRGGQTIAFPPPNAGYQLRAHPPAGNNTFLLLATYRPIPGANRQNYQYQNKPQRIVGTQINAIGKIRDQLRHVPSTEWQSAIHDIPVYR